MGQFLKQKVALPALLLLCFFLDGSLSIVMLHLVGDSGYRMYALCLLIALTLSALELEPSRLLYGSAFVLGALYDLYYNGILGVHVFLWPLLVSLTVFARPYLLKNFYGEWFWILFVYMLYMQLIYWLYRLLGINYFLYGEFLTQHFFPSLVLNAFLALIMIFIAHPLTRWLRRR